MSDFSIEYRSPGELKARKRQFRTHSDAQIDHLAESISSYGFNQAVGLCQTNMALRPHG